MTNDNVEVRFSRQILREIKTLKRRFRHIDEDLKETITDLKAGKNPGDRLQDIETYLVYKMRLKNRDARRGKRGGYRLIYYVQTAAQIYLLTIYAKSDQENISTDIIQQIIDEIEN
jgi:mRNA-degrading endonuclease RelE of RelBE toxin-antitoxin system